MKKDFIAIDHGKRKMNISSATVIGEPTEIHHKIDGDINNQPTFAVLIETAIPGLKVVGEISLEMLNNGLKTIGYQMQKIEKTITFEEKKK